MERLWFRAKRYGWGWYPATWEGWLVLVVFFILISANAYRIDAQSSSVNNTLIRFIPETFVLAAVLIAICAATGEKPRWRWGK